MQEKRREVAERSSATPAAELVARLADAPPPRDFVGRLASAAKPAVIAEIKRRSPSAGWIRDEYRDGGFDPVMVALDYESHGASAISCLTDTKFFAGELSFLSRVRQGCGLPILRKDFIIDPWQVDEARVAGADAVLLIAECLPDQGMLEGLADRAGELGMGVLLEIHDEANLERAEALVLAAPGRLLGINNRDLSVMQTRLEHSLELAERVRDRGLLVSESGIRTGEDLRRLAGAGVGIVLVGEHLMRQTSPGRALAELLGRG